MSKDHESKVDQSLDIDFIKRFIAYLIKDIGKENILQKPYTQLIKILGNDDPEYFQDGVLQMHLANLILKNPQYQINDIYFLIGITKNENGEPAEMFLQKISEQLGAASDTQKK